VYRTEILLILRQIVQCNIPHAQIAVDLAAMVVERIFIIRPIYRLLGLWAPWACPWLFTNPLPTTGG